MPMHSDVLGGKETKYMHVTLRLSVLDTNCIVGLNDKRPL